MRNPAIKFATIAFAITVIWTIIEHLLGYNTTNHAVGQYSRIITAFMFYACVAFAVFTKRKQQNNTLTFAEGFKTGALCSLLYGALVTIWFAVYAEVINTQFRPSLIAFERGKLEAANATPLVIAEKMKEVEMSSGGSVLSYLLLFVFMTMFGMIVATLAALILRRKPKPTTVTG